MNDSQPTDPDGPLWPKPSSDVDERRVVLLSAGAASPAVVCVPACRTDGNQLASELAMACMMVGGGLPPIPRSWRRLTKLHRWRLDREAQVWRCQREGCDDTLPNDPAGRARIMRPERAEDWCHAR